LPADPLVRWCALAAIFAESGIIDAPHTFLRALRLDKKTIETAGTGAMLANTLPGDVIGLKRLLAKHGVDIPLCAAEVAALFGHADRVPILQNILQSGECYSIAQLAIRGGDLIARGIAPGRQVGDVLQVLLDDVIRHPAANERDALLARVEELKHM